MRINKCFAVFLSLILTFAAADFSPALKAHAIAAPVITTESQVTKSTSITVTGTAEAGSTVTITGGAKTATGTTSSSGTFSISVTLNQNCSNTIYASATSIDGSVSSSTYIIIIQDTLKPDTPVILTSAQTTYQTSIIISGTAEAGCIVKITGGSAAVTGSASITGAFSMTVALTEDAVNTISVTCTDAAGNTSTAATVKITQEPDPAIDSDAPDTPTITTEAQYTSATSITVTGTAEGGSTVKVSGGYGSGTYIGTADNNGGYSITVKLTENAVNTLKVTATDAAGNVSGAASVKITQDDNVPDTPVIATEAQTTKSTSINITGTAEASSTVKIMGGAATVTGTAKSDGNYTITVYLNMGVSNTLSVTATDKAGNESTAATVNITQENGPNPPTLTTPSQTTSATSITVTGTAEAGSKVTITGGYALVIGTVDSDGNFSIDVKLNKKVVNTLYVMATDSTGIVGGAATLIVTQSDDSTMPVLTTKPQTTTASYITVAGTAEAGDTIKITGGLETITGTVSTKGVFSINVNLIENSVNILKVTAIDDDGIESNASTLVITQGTPSTTDTSDTSFSVAADANYSTVGTTKYFKANVSQTSGSTLSKWFLIVVTNLSDGTQTVSSVQYSGDLSSGEIAVDSKAVKSSVYVSDEKFDKTSIPKTYSLTKFVTGK